MMSKSALLIIDMQNDFVREDAPLRVAGAKAAIPAMQQVLNVFRKKELPIFHIVRIHRPDGSDVEIIRKEIFQNQPFAVEGTIGAEIIDELKPLPGEYVVKKVRMSAFIGTELDLMLKSLGVDTVMVIGIQTPNCVRATVFDAIAYNYHTILVTDAVAAQNEDIHLNNVFDMENIRTRIVTTSEIVDII